PAGEEPPCLLALGSQALGGEQRIGHVERPAHGEPFHVRLLAGVAVDADLADATGLSPLQDLETGETEAWKAGVHLRRNLRVGAEAGPRAVGAAAVEGHPVEVHLLGRGDDAVPLPEEGQTVARHQREPRAVKIVALPAEGGYVGRQFVDLVVLPRANGELAVADGEEGDLLPADRKSTRLNSSHAN